MAMDKIGGEVGESFYKEMLCLSSKRPIERITFRDKIYGRDQFNHYSLCLLVRLHNNNQLNWQ